MAAHTRGRPPASSREVLADAACELFLERGYEGTSVTEIARRAGVSRSSFFNYFTGKAEILWFGLDARIAVLADAARAEEADLAAAVAGFGEGETLDPLALAIVNAEPMGVTAELATGLAERQQRIAGLLAERLRQQLSRMEADLRAAVYARVVVAAIEDWADRGAGRLPLSRVLTEWWSAALRLTGEG